MPPKLWRLMGPHFWWGVKLLTFYLPEKHHLCRVRYNSPNHILIFKIWYWSHYELLKIRNDVLIFEFATSCHTRCSDLTTWSNTVSLFDKFAVFSEALANRWHQFASVWTTSKKAVFQLGKRQSDVLDRLISSLLAHLFYLHFAMKSHEHACNMHRAHVVFLICRGKISTDDKSDVKGELHIEYQKLIDYWRR